MDISDLSLFCDDNSIQLVCKDGRTFTVLIERKRGYTRYLNVFCENESINIYKDKITVESNGQESILLSSFDYKKFFNSKDEVIQCLLLERIDFSINEISTAIYELYMMRK